MVETMNQGYEEFSNVNIDVSEYEGDETIIISEEISETNNDVEFMYSVEWVVLDKILSCQTLEELNNFLNNLNVDDMLFLKYGLFQSGNAKKERNAFAKHYEKLSKADWTNVKVKSIDFSIWNGKETITLRGKDNTSIKRIFAKQNESIQKFTMDQLDNFIALCMNSEKEYAYKTYESSKKYVTESLQTMMSAKYKEIILWSAPTKKDFFDKMLDPENYPDISPWLATVMETENKRMQLYLNDEYKNEKSGIKWQTIKVK